MTINIFSAWVDNFLNILTAMYHLFRAWFKLIKIVTLIDALFFTKPVCSSLTWFITKSSVSCLSRFKQTIIKSFLLYWIRFYQFSIHKHKDYYSIQKMIWKKHFGSKIYRRQRQKYGDGLKDQSIQKKEKNQIELTNFLQKPNLICIKIPSLISWNSSIEQNHIIGTSRISYLFEICKAILGLEFLAANIHKFRESKNVSFGCIASFAWYH